MTPSLKIRSFTNDQYILDKVFYANFYKLRGFKDVDTKPLVVDVGAHAGYFTFTALSLGAKKVYAFEPFLENYKSLIANLGDNLIGETLAYQAGVYVSDQVLPLAYPKLTEGFFDLANIGTTSAGDDNRVWAAPAISLDSLILQYVSEPIDILKLSIGYAEYEILEASKALQSVKHLCGEAALDEAGQVKLRAMLGKKGFIDSSFKDVKGEDGKVLFHFSQTNCEEVFDLSE